MNESKEEEKKLEETNGTDAPVAAEAKQENKVSVNHMHKRMRNHILCICSTFLCCVFLNACSKRLHKRMQIHIGYTCLTFPHCAYLKMFP